MPVNYSVIAKGKYLPLDDAKISFERKQFHISMMPSGHMSFEFCLEIDQFHMSMIPSRKYLPITTMKYCLKSKPICLEFCLEIDKVNRSMITTGNHLLPNEYSGKKTCGSKKDEILLQK